MERGFKGSPLYKFAVKVCETSFRDVALEGLAESKKAGDTNESGLIRSWYHKMVFKLLEVIEAGVKNGVIKLNVREVVWPEDLRNWKTELGFTLVARPDEAYVGLPEMTELEFRFQGVRVDFQHEAVRKLERLVRQSDQRWKEITTPDLDTSLVPGDISAQAESLNSAV